MIGGGLNLGPDAAEIGLTRVDEVGDRDPPPSGTAGERSGQFVFNGSICVDPRNEGRAVRSHRQTPFREALGGATSHYT